MSNSTLGSELFAIVEIPPDAPTPDNVILTGPMDMLMQHIPDTIARTNEMRKLDLARFDNKQIQEMQEATRAFQVQSFCDGVARLAQRLDQLEARREAQARSDAEEEQRKIQDYLDSLPDPDDPSPHEPGTHSPGGELHQIPASSPEDEQQLEAIHAGGDPGPVPLSYGKLPLSYVKGEDAEGNLPHELTEKVPPDPGTDPVEDPEELAFPETPKQRAPAVFE